MAENKEFLQSALWLHFQETTGRAIVPCEGNGFVANGIIHTLPLVGNYLYVPRGPIIDNSQFSTSLPGGQVCNLQTEIQKLMERAKEKKCSWLRIEPETEEVLEEIKKSTQYTIVKTSHDVQPREIFKIDITKTEEVLLAQMKPKTRYNIRLAEKRGVKVCETREEKYIQAFLDLITATSGRKGITSHPRHYYRKFFEVLPEETCRLFVAEYEGRVLAANLIIFYEDTAIYLHGGSSDRHRDVMAPFLLQWEQIKRAKECGFRFYDFGGVHTEDKGNEKKESPSTHRPSPRMHSWSGMTKFKTGFAPNTLSTRYKGAYDIILNTPKYRMYRMLQRLRSGVHL